MSTATQPSDLQIPAGTWSVDPTHTRIGFVARHLMVAKVRGSFSDFSADIQVADDPLRSTLTAEVRMASIDTGNGDRDGHLRTNDFFDIEQYPTMSLRSTRFEAQGGRVKLARRPHDQGCDEAGRVRPRVRWHRSGSVGRHPRRVQRHGHDQPQGLGHRVERTARDRRGAGR